MAIYHISGSGSDSSDGSSRAKAFRTIQYAFSQITEDSSIYVWGGVYLGAWTLPNYNVAIIGKEENKFDAQGATNFVTGNAGKVLKLYNLDLWNWDTGRLFTSASAWAQYWCFNSVFAKTGAYYQTGFNMCYFAGFQCNFRSCTIFGQRQIGLHDSGSSGGMSNCLILGNDAGFAGGTLSVRHTSATNLGAAGDGSGCFDADTYPPPIVSANTSTPDFRFDSGHAQFPKYMTGGEYGCPIGAIRGLGASGVVRTHAQQFWAYSQYNFQPAEDMDQAGSIGAWANNDNFFDKSFNPVTIATGTNDKIDFVDDGGTHAATLTAGTYTSGASLATEVQTQMNAVASDTITVPYLADGARLQIGSDGSTTFSLLWNTGTNVATSAGPSLGFSAAADDTGDFTYNGDDYLVVGSGTATDAPAKWDDAVRAWTIDTVMVPGGTDAEVVTPVNDAGLIKDVKYVLPQEYVEGTGAIAWSFRVSSSSFTQQNNTVSWVSATKATEITTSNQGRFSQYKAALSI